MHVSNNEEQGKNHLINDECIRSVGVGKAVRLSFSQEQLWFLQRLEPTLTAYNLPRVFHLDGPLNADALARAFDAVIERHAVLRTRFFERDGIAMQTVEPTVSFSLATTDLSGLDAKIRQARLDSIVAEYVSHAFNLRLPPAMVAGLIKLGENEHVLASYCF